MSDAVLHYDQYKKYEEVVVEHRALKERQRRKEEQEKKEIEMATKVASQLCMHTCTMYCTS